MSKLIILFCALFLCVVFVFCYISESTFSPDGQHVSCASIYGVLVGSSCSGARLDPEDYCTRNLNTIPCSSLTEAGCGGQEEHGFCLEIGAKTMPQSEPNGESGSIEFYDCSGTYSYKTCGLGSPIKNENTGIWYVPCEQKNSGTAGCSQGKRGGGQSC